MNSDELGLSLKWNPSHVNESWGRWLCRAEPDGYPLAANPINSYSFVKSRGKQLTKPTLDWVAARRIVSDHTPKHNHTGLNTKGSNVSNPKRVALRVKHSRVFSHVKDGTWEGGTAGEDTTCNYSRLNPG